MWQPAGFVGTIAEFPRAANVLLASNLWGALISALSAAAMEILASFMLNKTFGAAVKASLGAASPVAPDVGPDAAPDEGSADSTEAEGGATGAERKPQQKSG